MNDRLRQELYRLFQRFGRDLLDDRGRLEAELWLAAGDQSQGMHALLGALDRKVPHAYRTAPPEYRGPELDAKLTRRLQNDLDLDEATSSFVVTCWRDAVLDAPDMGREPATPPRAPSEAAAHSSRPRAVPVGLPSDLPDLTIEDSLPPPPPPRRVHLEPLNLGSGDSASLSGPDFAHKPRVDLRPKKGRTRWLAWLMLGLLGGFIAIMVGVQLWHFLRQGRNLPEPRRPRAVEGHEAVILLGHQEPITCLAMHPFNNFAISGSFDRTVRFWDLNNRTEKDRMVGHLGAVLCVAISPDGRHALSGGLDKTVILWDLEQGRKVRHFDGPSGVTSVSFAPNGRTFLVAYGWKDVKHLVKPNGGQSMEWHRDDPPNCILIHWDVATGRELQRYVNHAEAVTCVSFLPDGKRAVSGSFDHALCLFEVDSGKEIRRFNGHLGEVFCLAVSPDGTRLLSGGGTLGAALEKDNPNAPPPAANPHDNSVRLWDITTGQEIRRFDGHLDLILSVAFSPNGAEGLTTSFDGTVATWNLATGDPRDSFRDHQTVVHAARFGPDGRHVLSGGWDNALRWWRSQ